MAKRQWLKNSSSSRFRKKQNAHLRPRRRAEQDEPREQREHRRSGPRPHSMEGKETRGRRRREKKVSEKMTKRERVRATKLFEVPFRKNSPLFLRLSSTCAVTRLSSFPLFLFSSYQTAPQENGLVAAALRRRLASTPTLARERQLRRLSAEAEPGRVEEQARQRQRQRQRSRRGGSEARRNCGSFWSSSPAAHGGKRASSLVAASHGPIIAVQDRGPRRESESEVE